MTAASSIRLYTRIRTDAYVEMPYTSMEDFVKDTAAICKKLPHMMNRKTDGTTTIFTCLEFATTANQLGYLMNFAKFVALHPHIQVMYGTTQNEAFNTQLKSYFRNVMVQTCRNAKVVCQIATMGKLTGGTLMLRHV